MQPIRQNALHIVTLLLFTGLLVHCTRQPHHLGWVVLFLMIELNAFLFILYKPFTTIAWITIMVGILGLIMSTPQLVSLAMEHIKGEPHPGKDRLEIIRSAVYFSASALFSFIQINRIIR